MRDGFEQQQSTSWHSFEHPSRRKNPTMLCRETPSACTPVTCQLCSKHSHCSSTLMASRHALQHQLPQTMLRQTSAALQLAMPHSQQAAPSSTCTSASVSYLFRTHHQDAYWPLSLLLNQHLQCICTIYSCVLLKVAWCVAFLRF